jgi:formylglycine-generating enzyme required for sulfatase activity
MVEDHRYIDNLITVLGDELQMTGAEIADVLWLVGQRYQYNISQVARRNSPNLPLNNIQIDKVIDSSIPEKTIEETPEVPLIEELANIPIQQTDKIPVVSPRTNNSTTTIQNRATLPIRVPNAPAIQEPLKFAYALRSLTQKVPSGKRDVLDENATAQIIAETNICQLVLKPELEPWLDVAVIIDESPSMNIWGHTIKDFQLLVEHYGIFRNVHIWGLVTDKTDPTKEQVKILPRIGRRSKQRSANYQELIDPNGRRLILIVSDCVSNIWHNGAMLEPLQGWSKYQPVVILQMLPDWFWLRTGLGNGASVLLKSAGRGATNHNLLNHNLLIDELLLRKDFNLVEGIKLPVINLEPDLARAWSQVLIGKNDVLTAGFVLPSPQQWDDLQDELRSLNLLNDRAEESFDAKDRVDHFRQTASPIARKLAGLLAAAPLINLPVVRIIQETLLSQSNQVHVAEVFLGGLLRAINRTKYDGEEALNNPDGVVYDFMDPEIRQILLRDAPVSDSATVFNAVSLYFAQRLNKSLDEFVAFLQTPGLEKDALPEMVAFAELSIQVLKGMGGQYAEFADRMQDSLIGSEVIEEYVGDFSQFAQIEQYNIEFSSQSPMDSESEVVNNIGLKTFKFETVTVNEKGEIIKREYKSAQYFTEILPGGVELDMVLIPAGEFMMGAKQKEKGTGTDEYPQHNVTITQPFFMGKYPVTQAQYEAIMGENPSHFEGNERPVECITWNDAKEFCEKLSQLTGKKYCLPSEAQWEYAGRGGTTTPFHFGETITSDLANYNGNYTHAEELMGKYRAETTNVGIFPPNAFGLYDIHGNVYEWCEDTWHDNYDGSPTDSSAWVSPNSNSRLLRGGSWINGPYCRVANRYDCNLMNFDYRIGFRVVQISLTQEISVLAKYKKLQKLLEAGEWKEADQETARVMLQVAGREKEGWLNIDSIENFPCEDLRTIDQLWVKYSNSRFGFSVQKNIWLECGGKVDWKTECTLGDRLGWRVKGEWIDYDEGTFSMKASPGHLPLGHLVKVTRVGGMWGAVGYGCAFFSRIKSCKL